MAISAFQKLRIQYNLPIQWPAPPEHITSILFISYCFEQGYAANTIRTYISGLAYKHKLCNWYDPSSIFLIHKLLEGCSELKKTKHNRAPILLSKLKTICIKLPVICYDEYESILFNSAFIVAYLPYLGMFRISELVFTTVLHSDRPLNNNDVSFQDNNKLVIIIILDSKTSSNGVPVKLMIPCEKDTENGHVCCLRKYLHHRPKSPGYLFIHRDGSPLNRTSFLAYC